MGAEVLLNRTRLTHINPLEHATNWKVISILGSCKCPETVKTSKILEKRKMLSLWETTFQKKEREKVAKPTDRQEGFTPVPMKPQTHHCKLAGTCTRTCTRTALELSWSLVGSYQYAHARPDKRQTYSKGIFSTEMNNLATNRTLLRNTIFRGIKWLPLTWLWEILTLREFIFNFHKCSSLQFLECNKN